MPRTKNRELFKQIGLKIKAKRESLNLSQEKLGVLLDVDYRHIYHYEIGRTKIPIDYLLKLAEFFNVPLEYFYSDFEGKNKLENQSVVKYPSNPDLDKAILAAKEIYEFGDEDLIVGVNNCINAMQVILKKRKDSRRNPNPVKRKRLAGDSK
ncbi:MAG: helix-turn-helix domain-containing protein [Deltaproteobacteria bacterium]|nr:helix-turn-helix domain-containing protein [Deltaproteobacteria bacterium]MCL5891896.1 helix-turn-helix domain-containing protein [Deltaproteobacteria bacterium]